LATKLRPVPRQRNAVTRAAELASSALHRSPRALACYNQSVTPVKPRPTPAACCACKARTVEKHCKSRWCTWVRCKTCRAVSGIAYGKLRSIGKAA
jgi:hypothetical protein